MVSVQLHAPEAPPSPDTHCIGGWVGPKTGVKEEEIPQLSLPGTESRSSSPWPSPYTDWATPLSHDVSSNR
jgi:hypothetical protein